MAVHRFTIELAPIPGIDIIPRLVVADGVTVQVLRTSASRKRERGVIEDVEELGVTYPSAPSVWQRGMRHGRYEEYVDWFS